MHCKPENYKDSRVQSHPAWINRFPGKRISKKEREEDKEEKTQEKKIHNCLYGKVCHAP